MASEYSDKFEKPLLAVISIFIVASLIAVVMLVTSHTPTCRSSVATYCGYESGF